MKKILNIAVLLALLPVLMMSSCKKDEPDAVNAYTTLKTYMIENSLDLPDLAKNWIIDPKSTTMGGVIDSISGTIPTHYVFDIRNATDFAAGHIKNAINVPLKDVVSTAANYGDKPICVVCYTGQTAGQAVMALRLSGFDDAVVLKWGMAGWNSGYKAPWVANSGVEEQVNGNIALGNANWVTTDSPALGSFDEPVWTSTATDGAAILKERVQAVLDGGFSPALATDVMANPSSFQIYNYWPLEDYTTFGHFSGAETCVSFVYQVPCFELLTVEEKQMLDAASASVNYKKGETICKQGAFASHIMYIEKGLVKVYLEGPPKDLILTITPRYNLIGLQSLFEGNNKFLFSVSTYTETAVRLIDIQVFKQLLRQNPAFCYRILNIVNESSNQAYGRFFSLTQKQLHGRLADILICLATRIFKSESFELPLSRSDLSDLTCMSTESVIRILKEFKDSNLIESNNKSIIIKDISRLNKISEKG